jgi:bacillithiol biosynthesis deacetylase BshB1
MNEHQGVDVLAFGAHPDDVELSCGGTICLLVEQGYRVVLVDMTRGELGSRGSVEQRALEADAAATILGIETRVTLSLEDGRIEDTPANREQIIRAIRKYRPRLMIIGAPVCRHPDHCAATKLCGDAAFYAGLRRIRVTDEEGHQLEPWRPSHILHYMQALDFEPTFVVDVTSVWERRVHALQAYRSQFHNPDYESQDDEPETYISSPAFLKWIEGRARSLGYRVGAQFAEGFKVRQGPFEIKDLMEVFG